MNGNDSTRDNPYDPFVRFWQDALGRMAPGFGTAGAGSADSLQQFRRMFFDAMAKYCDDFMRSPQFLDMMKQTMDQALNFRKQVNQFLASALQTAQAPTQDDMGEILETLRRIQHGLLQRVEELSDRVSAMDGGGKRRSASGGRPRKRSAARRPAAKRAS